MRMSKTGLAVIAAAYLLVPLLLGGNNYVMLLIK